MLCAFCNITVAKAIVDTIIVIDGDCPSSCDDGVIVKVRCPECGNVLWAKTIAQEYATRHAWPSWVKIDHSGPQKREEWSEEFYLVPKDDCVEIWQRNTVIASGAVYDPLPDDLPEEAELHIEGDRICVFLPARRICSIVE